MSIELILLAIFLPLTIIVTSLFLFIWLKNLIGSKRNTICNKLESMANLERLMIINTDISRVHVISSTNRKVSKMFHELEEIHTQIDNKIKDARKMIKELSDKKWVILKKDFNKRASDIREIIFEIDELEKRFNDKTKAILKKDEHLRSEYAFYLSKLRQVFDLYSQKRLILDKLAPKLDSYALEIKEDERLFQKSIDYGDIDKSITYLQKIIKDIKSFATIMNEAPNIEVIIYKTIPNIMEKLIIGYNKKKDILSLADNFINFVPEIKECKELHQKAKQLFLNLNMQKSKEKITDIFSKIKIMQKQINFEVKTRNNLFENQKNIFDKTKKTLEVYIEVKTQIKNIINTRPDSAHELSDIYEQMRTYANDVDAKAVSLKQVISKKEFAFSTIQNRAKELMIRIVDLTIKINEAISILWLITSESSMVGNKFKQAEAAFNEVIANGKKMNINFSEDENNQINIVSKRISEISSKIIKGIEYSSLSKEVEKLMVLSIALYKSLSIKIQIAEIISNLIKYYAPQRAIDEQLNLAFNRSERLYLEGNYIDSFNTIISQLNNGGR